MKHVEETQETQHVFISYIRKNKDQVDRLCEELTLRGIKVWVDRQAIAPGKRWKEEIRNAIHEGAFFIACFSKEYYERKKTHMNEEVTVAVEDLRQRHTDQAWFIPVKLNECEIPSRNIGGGETLRDLQCTALYEDWDAGIQRIVEVLQPEPPELKRAEEYNKRGEACYKEGNLGSAIADYDKAIKQDPEFHEAYNNLGNAYRDQGDFDGAIYKYTMAIELAPEYPYPYNGRGDIYKDRGEFDKAIKDYKKAIKLKRDYVPPYKSLAEVYCKRQEFDRAIENCAKAIELKPDSPTLYNNRGIIYRHKGEYDRAIADYTKAIEMERDSKAMELNLELPYHNRGNAYRDKKEHDRAIEDYNEAIKLKPDYALAYCNRGNAYFYKGEYDRAIKDYSEAIDFKKDYGTAYSNRAEAHLHLKQWKHAIANFKTATDKGYDIIASFHKNYKSVADFEAKNRVKVPADIAALLSGEGDKMNRPKVFLSYVKENESLVRILDQSLTDYGIDIVTDYRNILGGSNWKKGLKRLIENSGYFVVCFSKEFNKREQTVLYRELDHAIERSQDFSPNRKWIIPVRINECEVPSLEIRSREYLTDLHWIDLFPGAKWYEGVESIVRAIDETLITNPQEALASPPEIEILQKMGFDMGMYFCNELGNIRFNSRREYWSQSEWFVVTPEKFGKLPNYITAIVSGTREGILNEIRLSLMINDYSEKDNVYDAFIEKCNQLCMELCGKGLSDEIIRDLNDAKNSFTDNRIFSPHTIHTDNNYRLEGINVNMHNDVANESSMSEKPIRLRFHITKISFTA